MFSVAPMMDWTDRHCRAFHRTLSANALLYTEMVTADAVLWGDRARLLARSEAEKAVALQLGGNDPRNLARAVRAAGEFGYCAYNLNVGCPSDRVRDGAFGACLMRRPELVAECVAAMKAAAPAGAPVTVKHRLGVDDDEPRDTLPVFVAAIAAAGVDAIIIHARKAVLAGLSPKENREIPPLDYEMARKIKSLFPNLHVVINGGLQTVEQTRTEMRGFDGAMWGRAAYHHPARLLEIDPALFGQPSPARDIMAAFEAYFPYVEARCRENTPLHAITRHLLGAFSGRRGGRHFRRVLSEDGVKPGAGPEVLRRALAQVEFGTAGGARLTPEAPRSIMKTFGE